MLLMHAIPKIEFSRILFPTFRNILKISELILVEIIAYNLLGKTHTFLFGSLGYFRP